ncbi:MAG: fumarate hydratase [Anaerohalosphaeraceae bacterium]
MITRNIPYHTIVQAVRDLTIRTAYELPEDVKQALRDAAAKESAPRARQILDQLIENFQIAEKDRIPLCQDTGLAVVFVELGNQVAVAPPHDRTDATLMDAINEGIAQGYEEGFLRKSVVAEPLNNRKNTTTNTPAVIHLSLVPGDRIHITLMAKGGGCENKSQFKMFNPTEKPDNVAAWIVDVVKNAGANACPPFVVGVGLGGNFEQCCMLSKKALLRKVGSYNSDPYYAELEKKLLAAINASGLGPQGLGGDTTALGVFIETAPCHIASLPVAVNIECHSHRHAGIMI